MKEVTRIITAQITLIRQVSEYDADKIVEEQELDKKHIERRLNEMYSADDVTVSIQDFVMDK